MLTPEQIEQNKIEFLKLNNILEYIKKLGYLFMIQSLLKNEKYINYYDEIKKCEFYAKTYKFKSAFDSALFYEEVDKNVYNSLIKSVNDNLALFYTYCEKTAS